jgi:hypothetical protein
MRLDIFPGGENSAEMGTKQFHFTAEIAKKGEVFSCTAPFLFESEEITRILLKHARFE